MNGLNREGLLNICLWQLGTWYQGSKLNILQSYPFRLVALNFQLSERMKYYMYINLFVMMQTEDRGSCNITVFGRHAQFIIISRHTICNNQFITKTKVMFCFQISSIATSIWPSLSSPLQILNICCNALFMLRWGKKEL